MAVATAYEHVILDEQDVPVIEGANTKVVEIVLHIEASGISPEQLAVELPHLTPGQIHSAMAYYWDHKQELDADIKRREERVERLRRETGQPSFAERLRDRALA